MDTVAVPIKVFVILLSLLIAGSVKAAMPVDHFRNACMSYEKLKAGKTLITEEIESDAQFCLGYVGGMITSSRSECFFLKVAVRGKIKDSNRWGDSETFFRLGRKYLDNRASVNIEKLIREILLTLEVKPEYWNSTVMEFLPVFWPRYLEKYPDERCDPGQLIEDELRKAK